MVDVGGKEVTERRAVARAVVKLSPETAAAVVRGDAPKGDVIGTARLAGIQAAKRTAELIPLCHPLGLDHVDVEAAIDTAAGTVTITAEARVTARTAATRRCSARHCRARPGRFAVRSATWATTHSSTAS